MPFLYLTEQGAVLQREGERLLVTKEDQTLADVPVVKLEAVLVFGHVHLTTPALQLCLIHEVELALFTRRGRLLGQLTSPFPKNIELRQAQYARAADTTFTLSLAQTLVAAKLGNALEFLREFAHNHPDTDLAPETAQVAAARYQAAQAQDPARLLGLEGSGARAYFAAFAKMIRHTFGFTGRARHPAPDPVNALLSLGYTLVYHELSSLLDGLGFDPYLAFSTSPASATPPWPRTSWKSSGPPWWTASPSTWSITASSRNRIFIPIPPAACICWTSPASAIFKSTSASLPGPRPPRPLRRTWISAASSAARRNGCAGRYSPASPMLPLLFPGHNPCSMLSAMISGMTAAA